MADKQGHNLLINVAQSQTLNKTQGKPPGVVSATSEQQAAYYNAAAAAGFVLVPSTTNQNDAQEEKKEAQAPTKAPLAAVSRVHTLLRGMRGAKSIKVRLVDASAGLTSSAAATCYAAAPIYTTVMGLGEFTDFANVFDEFKVHAVKVHYIPFTPNKVEATINTNGRAIVVAYDSNDSTVPTGMQVLFANETAHVFSNQMVMRKSYKVDSSSPAVWYSTLSQTNPLVPLSSIKFAGDSSLGVSIPLGGLYFEFEVSFRMRR